MKQKFTPRQIDLFKAYHKVQRSGDYNMIMEADKVAEKIGCNLEEYWFTVNNYFALCETVTKAYKRLHDNLKSYKKK